MKTFSAVFIVSPLAVYARWPSISTRMMGTGVPELAEATTGVGQFTVELLPGLKMLMPPDNGFTPRQ